MSPRAHLWRPRASFATYSAASEQVLYFYGPGRIEAAEFSLYRLSDADAETLLRIAATSTGGTG